MPTQEHHQTIIQSHEDDDDDNNNNNNHENQQQQQVQQSPSSSPIITDTSQDPLSLAWHAVQEQFHTRNWIWFMLLGFINNYHFCVVISGAQSVAELFHLKNLMALISWANIAGGIFVRFLNAFVLMHWSYNKKYLAAGLQTLLGITIVCCSPYIGSSDGFRFFLTLCGILFIGTGSSFGEQTSLGYMNLFPAKTIGGWSSGTGLSGVVGSLVYLGLQNAGLNEPSIFAIQMPFVILYWGCYYFGVVLVPRNEVKVLENEGEEAEYQPEFRGALFTPIPNAKRSWKDEAQQGGSTSTTTSSSSTSSIKSQLEMKTDKNFADNNKENEKKPLLESSGQQRNDHQNQDSSNDQVQQQQHDYSDQEDETPPPTTTTTSGGAVAGRTTLATTTPDPSLTPVGENPEWSSFRRWLFRVAPVFPAEAIIECNKLILFQGLNLFLVYVFEYSVQFVAPDCFPDFSKKDHDGGSSSSNGGHQNESHNETLISNYTTTTTSSPPPLNPSCPSVTVDSFDFMTRNAFVISQFCYQFGVLISRSSLSVVRIKRVELLTILQLLNCIAWIVLAKTEWLINECDPEKQLKYTIIMMLWMILVGLQGGASYVNVFFNILNDEDLQVQLALIAKGELSRQKERKKIEEKRLGVEQPQLTPFKLNARELTMNVSALYQTLGITIGSLLDVIINNTLIKNR